MTESPVKSAQHRPKQPDQAAPLPSAPSPSKFLKRKPDHAKVFASPSGKKQREGSGSRGLGSKPTSEEAVSAADSRFITQKKAGRGSECGESLLLETAKS